MADDIRPLRVLAVGAGYFARFQLEGWAAAGAAVRAICDLDPAKARALATEFDIPVAGSDVAPLLASGDFDLVDVILPPAAQAEVVRAALGHGLPTICQKPFGRDIDEALELARLSRATGTPLVVHENFRFSPWYREARRLIDDGTLGALHGIAFRLRPGDGQGPEAYLARQPYFQTMPRLLVRETAVHFIDTFRYLMGEVAAVTARLRRINPAIAGEDAGLLIFEFESRSTGLFDGNRLNDHSAADTRRTMGEMWLEGERGVLRLDGDARLFFKPHHGPEREHAYTSGEGAFGGACTALQAHVMSHLRHGTPLENAAPDYVQNLRVQEAVYASHETGRRIAIEPFRLD